MKRHILPTVLLTLSFLVPGAAQAKKKDNPPPPPPGQYVPPGQTQPGGPPPWAPAHGYRAKQQYRYYPGHNIYMDPASGMYYFLQGGHWKHGGLPPGLSPGALGRYHEFDGQPGRPWKDNPYKKGGKKNK